MEQCKKATFATEKEAQQRLAAIKNHGEVRDKNPRRAYKCETCKLWHLTSMSKKKYTIGVVEGGFKRSRINRIARFWADRKGWDIDN